MWCLLGLEQRSAWSISHYQFSHVVSFRWRYNSLSILQPRYNIRRAGTQIKDDGYSLKLVDKRGIAFLILKVTSGKEFPAVPRAYETGSTYWPRWQRISFLNYVSFIFYRYSFHLHKSGKHNPSDLIYFISQLYFLKFFCHVAHKFALHNYIKLTYSFMNWNYIFSRILM